MTFRETILAEEPIPLDFPLFVDLPLLTEVALLADTALFAEVARLALLACSLLSLSLLIATACANVRFRSKSLAVSFLTDAPADNVGTVAALETTLFCSAWLTLLVRF